MGVFSSEERWCVRNLVVALHLAFEKDGIELTCHEVNISYWVVLHSLTVTQVERLSLWQEKGTRCDI